MQDKRATAERNPLRFVPAVPATKIDCFSTDRGGAPLTESLAPSSGSARTLASPIATR